LKKQKVTHLFSETLFQIALFLLFYSNLLNFSLSSSIHGIVCSLLDFRLLQRHFYKSPVLTDEGVLLLKGTVLWSL